MADLRKDGLLIAAKAALLAAQIAIGIAASAVTIAAGTMLVVPDKIVAEIGGAVDPQWFWALPTVLVLVALALGFAFVFVEQLRRIVATVGDGDPFVPANAARLHRMGWYALAVVALEFPVTWLGYLIDRAHDGAGDLDVSGDLSLSGVVLALVLFILARVFRHGTALRDDLEGTV